MKTFLPLLALIGLCGCAAISPDSDPVVVNAERATAIAFDTVDSFLKLEHAHRAFFTTNAPSLHAAAETLRAQAPRAFATVRTLTKTYKAIRSPENKAALETAIAVINQLGFEAGGWFALAQPRKTTYDTSPRSPRHFIGEFTPRTDPQGTPCRQAGWRMDAGTGSRVRFQDRAEDVRSPLAA